MHAVVVQVTFGAGRIEEATKGLHEDVVPTTKAAPGFQSGTWSHNADTLKGVGMVLFDTADNANGFISLLQSQPMPDDSPVTFDSVGVYEVAAQA